eukprot:8719633-Pyramimonas_sp.AAC.1
MIKRITTLTIIITSIVIITINNNNHNENNNITATNILPSCAMFPHEACDHHGSVIPIPRSPAQLGLANTSSEEFQHVPPRKRMP